MSVESAIESEDPNEPIPISLFGRFSLPDLPVAVTPLIGRERAVVEVVELVRDPDVRLVTLTGPGGIGKTRLALAVAQEFAEHAVYIPLAAISEPGLIASAIAQALGLEQRIDQTPLAFLRDVLRDRELIMVLDNFEHLISGAPLVSGLLSGCPRLTILVTSRVRLALSGEHVVPVDPLTLPQQERIPQPRDIAESSAVRLFVDRARAAHPAFALTDRNASAIATICRRLDGLPLAIELAAARSNLLSPEALAARLEHRLQLLTGGPQDVPARLQTMRAAIAWSSDLLSDGEREFWERLGVFSGGFTAEAAESVGRRPGSQSIDSLGALQSLIDQGLLRPVTNAAGEPRFMMLETTRDFASERLEALGTGDLVRGAHAAWFRSFATIIEPGLMGAEQELWFNRAEAEIANFRDAMAWLRDRGEIEAALELAGSLAWFWTAPNYITEGRTWYDSLLGLASSAVDPAVRAKALMAAGDLADWHTDTDRAVALHGQALALWREVGDRKQIAVTLRGLGSAAIDHFDFNLAESLLGEARTLAIECGDDWTAAATANLLAVTFFERGDFAHAVQWHEQSLREWQGLGDRDHFPVTLNGLGMTYVAMGENQRAWDSFDAALTIAEDREDDHEIAKAPLGYGLLAASTGQAQIAVRLLSSAARQRREIGIPLRPPNQRLIDATVERLRAETGEASFARVWAEGQEMTVSEAVIVARSVTVPSSRSEDGLSHREREVLRLLVEGASDHEIADHLFISRRTASKHVAAILEKLGASNRTAAATIAHRREMV